MLELDGREGGAHPLVEPRRHAILRQLHGARGRQGAPGAVGGGEHLGDRGVQALQVRGDGGQGRCCGRGGDLDVAAAERRLDHRAQHDQRSAGLDGRAAHRAVHQDVGAGADGREVEHAAGHLDAAGGRHALRHVAVQQQGVAHDDGAVVDAGVAGDGGDDAAGLGGSRALADLQRDVPRKARQDRRAVDVAADLAGIGRSHLGQQGARADVAAGPSGFRAWKTIAPSLAGRPGSPRATTSPPALPSTSRSSESAKTPCTTPCSSSVCAQVVDGRRGAGDALVDQPAQHDGRVRRLVLEPVAGAGHALHAHGRAEAVARDLDGDLQARRERGQLDEDSQRVDELGLGDHPSVGGDEHHARLAAHARRPAAGTRRRHHERAPAHRRRPIAPFLVH